MASLKSHPTRAHHDTKRNPIGHDATKRRKTQRLRHTA